MTFTITQGCCHDASCLAVCPVNCIHPTRDEPEFGTVEMLYVDERSCIDCGACADACPVDAVTFAPRLRGDQRRYVEINAAFYRGRDVSPPWPRLDFPGVVAGAASGLRFAVVGTGPAAAYTVEELLRLTDGRVTVFDRSPQPGGLVRFGVAPDHVGTRRIADRFARTFAHPRVRLRLATEVGRDITADELAADFDAVVYAVGAGDDRLPDVAGWGMPGSMAARTVVGWYTGDPAVPDDAVDLSSTERVVVIGTGNVALDVARVLVSDPDRLARSDIAPAALAALRSSAVREVVVIGRRGPEAAAYSAGELTALRHLPGADLVVDDHGGVVRTIAAGGDRAALLRGVDTDVVDWGTPPPPGRRIVLSFERSPVALTGTDAVRGLRTADGTEIAASVVLAATGYRGKPVPGLPFAASTGTVPHDRGRVLGADGAPVRGAYVVGWIKRGAAGGIGANRRDAEETVASLLQDLSRSPATLGGP
jgi:ferredoxin--NADP+ reductase